MATMCPKCGNKMSFFDVAVCSECKAKDDQQEKIRAKEEGEQRKVLLEQQIHIAKKILVTTADLQEPYEVIAPIVYNTTNRGLLSSNYSNLEAKYCQEPFDQLVVAPELSPQKSGDGTLLISLFDPSFTFEGSVGQRHFDKAYYLCVAELKLRALQLGGDAIVGMRMDFDLDTTNWGAFYLQMYGTVVRRTAGSAL